MNEEVSVERNVTTMAMSQSPTPLLWPREAQVSPELPQSSYGPGKGEGVDDQFSRIPQRALNRRGQCKVLVVDDSKVNNKVLIKVLKQIHIPVEEDDEDDDDEEENEGESPVVPLDASVISRDRSSAYRHNTREVSTAAVSVWSFTEADDGSMALQLVQEALAEGNPFDVVFMDNTMIRMHGPEAAQRMRSAGFQGLIVGVTGNVMAHDVAHFVASGADCVLFKPVNVEELKQLLVDSFA